MTYNQTNRGSSLLELSIVLVIVGILISGSLLISASYVEQTRKDITAEKLAIIENALVIFLGQNNRLPCPASLGQKISNSTFGYEKIITSNSPATCDTSTNNINIFSGDLNGDTQYMGAVPVRSLGLSDEYMFDGWNNRISYVVQRSFINNTITNPACVSGDLAAYNHSDQYICFQGQASDPNLPNNNYPAIIDKNNNIITSNVVYILISHGPNGYGAFFKSADVDLDNQTPSLNTLQNPLPTSALELQNLNCTSAGSCTQNGLDQYYVLNQPTQGFDDILRFKTRNNLLLLCNKFSNSKCTNSGGILLE